MADSWKMMRTALALLCAMLISLASAAGQETPPETALPDAQVIAHGIVTLPPEASWRIVSREAVSPEKAEVERRAPRFILAEDDAIAVVDETGAILARLAPGEVAWAAGDAPRAVVSLDANRADYYEIALVPAAQFGTDAAVTAPFPVPPAEAFDVELIRDVLARNEESELPSGLTPMLLLMTAGKVFVEQGDSEVAELSAGEFLTVDGGVVVVGASRTPAAFVVARVSAPVAERVTLKSMLATPAATPVPAATPLPGATPVARTDGVASLYLTAHVCPPGYEETAYATDCAEPAGGVAFSLEAGGETLLSELSEADGEARFRDVPAGEYTLLAGLPQDAASSWVSCRSIRGEAIRQSASENRIALPLTPSDHRSCDWFIVPDEAESIARASIQVTVRACPPGMTPDRFTPNACTDDAPDVRLTLRDSETGRMLDAVAGSSSITWNRLPSGSYGLDVERVPDGYVNSALDGEPCCGEVHDFTIALRTGYSRLEPTLYLFPPEMPRDLALTVLLQACPPGMTAEDLVPEFCTAAPPGATLTLLEYDEAVGVASATAEAWAWSGLAALDYTLQVNALPEGFTGYLLDGASDEADLTITLSADEPAAQRILYLFPPPDDADPEIDTDADGLPDAREREIGTHPFSADMDGDGLSDRDEVSFYSTDPAATDTDGDGLTDTEEVQTHATNPLLADTDGDGAADGREITTLSDPLDSASLSATPTPAATPASLPTVPPEASPIATLALASAFRNPDDR